MNNDNYILKKVINEKGCTIRVFSPILTDEERKRRIEAIHKATANLFK